MAKQVHVRLDDKVYNALTEYSAETGNTVQSSISGAVIQYLKKINHINGTNKFTFIDLFAGIGGMRIGFESAGGNCVYSNESNCDKKGN